MEGKHLVILCNIAFGDQTVASHALIDCGATGVAFVDEDFTRHHRLPLIPLKRPRALEVIDGRPISSGDITHTADVTLSILDHHERIPMFVTKLGHYPIVLGIPWMELHDVAVRFSSRTLTFGSQYCTVNCNPVPTVAHAITSEPPEPTLCSLAPGAAPCEPAPRLGPDKLNGAGLGLGVELNGAGLRLRPDKLNGAGLGLGLELNGAELGLMQNSMALDSDLDPTNSMAPDSNSDWNSMAPDSDSDLTNSMALDSDSDRNSMVLDSDSDRNSLAPDSDSDLTAGRSRSLHLEAALSAESPARSDLPSSRSHSMRSTVPSNWKRSS
jgi:hypothetical protein